MLVSGIKSRPTYGTLTPDPGGRRHLLVCDAQPDPSLQLLASMPPGSHFEVWAVEHTSRILQQPMPAAVGAFALRPFRARQQLLDRLACVLAAETMGFRLYALGEEAFVWDVANVARAAGLDEAEMQLAHRGSERRRVYCVHCRTRVEGATTNVVTCSGCGASLLVRDHYSRRLAAFMGVQVDAEVPGELPDIEEIFP